MHRHLLHKELKQNKKTKKKQPIFFFGKLAGACVFCKFSSVVSYRNPSAVNCRCSHTSALKCRISHVSVSGKLTTKLPKIAKNKPIKSNNTFFLFYVKHVLIPPKIDASMILEQDLMKKYWILGVLMEEERKVMMK